MNRWHWLAAVALGATCLTAVGRAQSRPADKPNFSGDWTLNRELSDEPRVGAEAARGTDDRRGGGGRRGGFGGGMGGRGGFGGMGRRGYGGGGRQEESADARTKLQELADEARLGSETLTISHSGANIAVTDSRGRTRFFQTNGSRDKHQLVTGTIDSTTRWAGDQLVTEYDAGNGRKLTYTYSLVPNTRQFLVRVRIDGPSGGAVSPPIKYVYDRARAR
jgi:hypothetical protein